MASAVRPSASWGLGASWKRRPARQVHAVELIGGFHVDTRMLCLIACVQCKNLSNNVESLQKVPEHQACSATGDVERANSFMAKWRSLGRRLRKVMQSYAIAMQSCSHWALFNFTELAGPVCTRSFLKSSRGLCVILHYRDQHDSRISRWVKDGQGRQPMTLHHFRVDEACRSLTSIGLLYERCGPLLLENCRRARN